LATFQVRWPYFHHACTEQPFLTFLSNLRPQFLKKEGYFIILDTFFSLCLNHFFRCTCANLAIFRLSIRNLILPSFSVAYVRGNIYPFVQTPPYTNMHQIWRAEGVAGVITCDNFLSIGGGVSQFVCRGGGQNLLFSIDFH